MWYKFNVKFRDENVTLHCDFDNNVAKIGESCMHFGKLPVLATLEWGSLLNEVVFLGVE